MAKFDGLGFVVMPSARMSKEIHGIGVTLIADGVMTVREGRG